MKKLALIFVNGLEQDPAKLVQLSSRATVGAYNKTLGFFSRGKEFETVVVHVLDIQTLMAVWQNVDKYGINHFLVTNDPENPGPMETVLAVGPEEPEKLNKMSANLRLF